MNSSLIQQKELVQLKREARLKGGFYVNPEAKLLFIVRIRGYVSKLLECVGMVVLAIGHRISSFVGIFKTFSINAMHPKTRTILQLLRLRQVTQQILKSSFLSWFQQHPL